MNKLYQNIINLIKDKYDKVYLIMSPPRCASTAISRLFWEFPSVGYYSHEPFESFYYLGASLEIALLNILNSIELKIDVEDSRSVLVKEMPYQVGEKFEYLLDLTDLPVLFLIRNPIFSIDSRIKKKIEAGQDPNFPTIETGWELLQKEVELCEHNNKQFYILDTDDFRMYPKVYLEKICNIYDIEYSEEYLTWKPRRDLDLDNLDGKHTHLYERVLSSKGVEPPEEHHPNVKNFPENLKNHMELYLGIYRKMKDSKHRL